MYANAKNVFIAHPASPEQIKALKAFVKALNIKFEVTKIEQPYDEKFVAQILRGDEDKRARKGKTITIEEINSL